MAGRQLSVNIPSLLGSYERVTTVYIKQYGAGNLRIATRQEDLLTTVGQTWQEGIAQATVDGWKQYFWEGDLWVISDAAGIVAWLDPSYQYNVRRGSKQRSPIEDVIIEGDIEGDLSTY